MNNDLANRMKENYEKRCEHYLLRRIPVAIRLDGKAFHSFTKGFERPFDNVLIKTMQSTMKYLCENIQGCVLGYHQSDEITLILCDYQNLDTESWFDYRQNKMESVSASMATLAFNRVFAENVKQYKNYILMQMNTAEDCLQAYQKSLNKGALFDSRSFNIPKEEVTNLLLWRQQDATRNSINMVAQFYFSKKELHGKSCNEMQEMLFQKHNINWDKYPIYLKRGSCCVKNHYKFPANENTYTYERNVWEIDFEIPIFNGDGRKYVEKRINFD